ncbi:SWI/SNF complex subunit SWI3D [Typha latifolia]|uniref:SWI/SNF complex subunit SWI3D n=1 Tax=Typha latifolia TaxID=4733 RepID=UPI003C2E09DF
MEAKPREASVPPAAGPSARPPPPTETLPEPPRRRGGAAKRKAASAGLSSTSSPSSLAPSSKRLAKERNPIQYHLPPIHNGPCTRARQSPNKFAVAAPQKPPGTGLSPFSAADGGGNGMAVVGDPAGGGEEEMAEEPLVDPEFEAVRSRGVNVHVIPTFAGWFSWKEIHQIEKQSLDSFFNGKSEKRTPEIYLELRNSIMKKFHADPKVQVELKDLAELSVGDMDARQEVMEFLDHWGLINFHPFPPSEHDKSKSGADGGDKTPSLLDKLYQFDIVQSYIHSVPKRAEPSITSTMPCFLRESALSDDLVTLVEPSVEYHCNSCSADCSRKRYHCQKQADFDLCSDCYNEGKFGTGMAPADFILMEPAEAAGASGASWTDQETLLLLEALELFGANWSEIAEHVATKTKAQCMLHFLQMPIEDSFLEGEGDANETAQERKGTSADREATALTAPDKMEVENKVEEKVSSDISASEKTEDESIGRKNEPDDLSVPGTKDVKNSASGDPPISSNGDAVEKKESADIETSAEGSTNIAIDALRSAFHAVDYFPEKGNSGSFAEAGNPVMALAAFLAGLLEHDNAITSCRSSLKAILEESPSVQLATRHCLILEDPPSDVQNPPAFVSSAANIGDEESHKDDIQMPDLDVTDKVKVCEEKNEENTTPLEKEIKPSASSETYPEMPAAKESCEVPSLEATTNTAKDSSGLILSEEKSTSNNPKDAKDSSLTTAVPPDNGEEKLDLVSKEVVESSDKEMNDSKPVGEDKPSNTKELGDLDSDKVQLDVLKADETMATSTAMEEQESKQTSGAGSLLQDREKADECTKKEAISDDVKNSNSTESHDDHTISRLKRAAATAISAAAVKAKLLAKQEEDQIRHLVSLIIQKQLQKMEAKLSFFTDIENVIMRVREQTDRTRQRLLHERSQIIAARLGLPTPSFRPNPSSIPTSRFATGYGMAGPKPLNMVSQKPPAMRRP